jgi:hypothetical protein
MHGSWKSRGWSLGFLANSVEGVLGVVRKSVRGSFLSHFYVEVFKNLYRGYMRCPPPPSPPCVHLWVRLIGYEKLKLISHNFLEK